MIQLTTPDDRDALLALAQAVGLFDSDQIVELTQMLDQYFSNDSQSQNLWLTDYDHGPVGVAYAGAEPMTHGTWNLYLIAIHPNYQKQGRGSMLLKYIEKVLAERGERVLLVETSGTDEFQYVRAFYRNNGYEEEARIRDFYADGVDKVVFRKVLRGIAL
ncbi:GNAT family N-acetyltransferase [Thermosynechococcaceae cyanobacterium BACA0444]|uniref:GNAT family N-acetyltransferase n=1 Tax=Pseudocalidococcus azoricus BACA0444 TaxID=2918990 RepID=A0AAE4JY40_9CYAN|nr:GNAT family N-acetyltransferase [Pseudocalidococcus azoricus]MDS3859347.1 GNAT family N-acetyltransferase [Pseudocalidococcus azoricus BACA0444]